MRILIYRWKAYNYTDIIASFQQMGHQVDEIKKHLENYDRDEEFSALLEDKLRKGAYGFVFTVNYFALISEVCERRQVPYVCWSCDSPLISMYHESVFNSCNRIFLFDRCDCREFEAMGVEHVYHLPLAVDTGRVDHILGTAEDLASPLYQNEISFVGSLYEKNSYDRLQHALPEYLQGYLEAVMEAQRDLQGIYLVERLLTPDILMELEEHFHLAQSSEGSFSDLGLIFSVTVLGFKIAQLQRKSALLELAKRHAVSLYSNSDAADLLRVTYKGSVDYWTQLPKVFAASRINLNMTIPNIKTGIPLRVFDVLAAGGFLLTNFQAEIPEHFTDGKELVCYYSEDDLVEKASYYKEHEAERKKIAEAGREAVGRDHTYQIRMAQLMKVLRETI